MLGAVSPAGPRARLSTLIFHRVTPAADPMFPGEVDARRFDTICTWLRRWTNVLPLEEAVDRMNDGSLPARALCITLDDGYADSHDVALPILRRHGLNATFFVASAFIGGGIMWNDRICEAVRLCGSRSLRIPEGLIPERRNLDLSDWVQRRRAVDDLLEALKYLPLVQRMQQSDAIVAESGVRLPEDLMMSKSQVAGLVRAGMHVGGHTVNHPILTRIGEEAALREMLDGKSALEEMTQQPVRLFAYPNGRPDTDYSLRDVCLAQRAGFKAAFCTARGSAATGDDLFQLPRSSPRGATRLRFGLRLAMNMHASARPVLASTAVP
jgi:peptidoglycan/xylan/chitin deacetylase (PgdA/CDA1 family)